MAQLYADLIIPVALAGTYTYLVQPAMTGNIRRGSLVTVPFGQSRSTTGLVVRLHDTPPEGFTPREIV